MQISLNQLVVNIEESATEIVDNEIKKMKREGVSDIVSLGVGEPYFDTPQIIKEAAKKALDEGKTKYQPTFGDYELREAIRQKFLHKNKIASSIENIMVTPGAKFAIFLSMQAILNPGDKVLIIEPAWVSHISIPLLMGANLVRVTAIEENGYQPDVALISNKIIKDKVKCVIINSPCNPTGAVFSADAIRSIVEIAQKQGAVILSDEIYEDLIYQGEHYSPGSEFDNVVTINGFSKSYAMTGWRLGYATGPGEIMSEINKIYQHSASCVTAFAQAGAIEALCNPKAFEETKKMVNQFRLNREIIVNYLSNSNFFEYTPTFGAFYCFAKYHSKIKSVDLCKELLHKNHVAAVPGSAFGECGEYHLRLSYATSKDNLEEGLKRIDNFVMGI